jgi:hypothetical protein
VLWVVDTLVAFMVFDTAVGRPGERVWMSER